MSATIAALVCVLVLLGMTGSVDCQREPQARGGKANALFNTVCCVVAVFCRLLVICSKMVVMTGSPLASHLAPRCWFRSGYGVCGKVLKFFRCRWGSCGSGRCAPR